MPILYYIMIQENIGSDHQKNWIEPRNTAFQPSNSGFFHHLKV